MFEKLQEDLSKIFGKTETVQQETKTDDAVSGEGFTEEQIKSIYYGIFDAYSSYVFQESKQEKQRIKTYRDMAMYPEIGDVIEEICDEGTKEDDQGRIINIEITSDKIKKKKDARKNIVKEFNELFYKKVRIQEKVWDFMYSFLVDGRLYTENITDTKNPKRGIIGMKKLPARTMDFEYDAYSGKILKFRQTIREGRKKRDIWFNPGQISYIDYGVYGRTRKQIYGYLEKAKIPYRQLKLLEDSAVIYRIVRAPERFVFKIDTGNMPRHKAEAFVNSIKREYKRQMTYNPSTGSINQSANVLSMLENFYIPTNSEGRGSEVDVLQGGASLGEIDDILYFLKKLYKALKYPANRVIGTEGSVWQPEGRTSSEISRDEVKFAKFIERIQHVFEVMFERLFMLHLDLRKSFDNYDLTEEDFSVRFTPPSSYKEVKDLEMEDLRSGVFQTLRGDEQLSPSWLMKKYLKWTDEDLEENEEELKKDIKKQKEFEKLRSPDEGQEGGFQPGGFGFGTMEQPFTGDGKKPPTATPPAKEVPHGNTLESRPKKETGEMPAKKEMPEKNK